MTLILCKFWSDTTSNDNDGEVGERINPIYWDSSANKNGFVGLREGNGNWAMLELEGNSWLVIDADDQIIDIEGPMCKFNTGVILFRGTAKELAKTDYCHKMATNSESAFNWAKEIGNHDVMIDRIVDSQYAFYWAFYIGNKDVMINRIADSRNAYLWAFYIGNKDVMISKIKESYTAYLWAINIGNRDIMINKITESQDAYCWAEDIGNHDIMKSKVTQKHWIDKWNSRFVNNQI